MSTSSCGPLCDKCQHMQYESYSSSSCPYEVCPECRELEVLDTQIAELHKSLVNLVTKRYEIKRKINRRHDRLTSRLPVEVISHIFGLIAGELYDCDSNTPSVLLFGAVCRRWRNITLGTPGLWTTLIIMPRKHVSFPDTLPQWLSRSSSLPLSLNIYATLSDQRELLHPSLAAQYSNVLQSIRSHAGRWKDLTLKVPMEMLHALLAGLEDRVLLDSLSMEEPDDSEGEMKKMTMEYLLVPKRAFISAPQIPVQWDRLTHLEVNSMGVDGIIHIFRHAHNLHSCLISDTGEDTGQYPIPISPVTNSSIKVLDAKDYNEWGITTSDLLPQLTLPSLETLHHEIWHDHRNNVDGFRSFLDRSQPPLSKFSFYYSNMEDPHHDFYPIFPSITFLALRVFWDDKGETIQGYLERLGSHMEPLALPSLSSLEISGSFMNPRSWDALAAIFPDSQTLPQRPLKTVKIDLDRQSNKNMRMQKATYTRLRAIQESGVSIKVITKRGNDILGSNVTLTRFESDGRHRRRGRSENGMVTLKFSDIDEGSSDDNLTYYADDGTEDED